MLRYPRLGLRLLLLLHAVAVVSLTAVATSTDTSNPFTWLDCPSPAPAPSPSSPASPTMNTSTFQSNVFALLDALPTAAAPTGFASLSRGDGTDRAFVRGLCRGDSTPENCTRYLQKAVLHIKAHCNSNRRAAIWYDKCFLSYADTNESTTYEEGFRQGICHDWKISDSDMDAFNTKTYVHLMINISDGAAHGEEGSSSALPSAVPMFETGEAVYDRGAPNGTMYGMVQCMRDRTAAECALCLWNSMWQLATSCSGHQGGVMLGYNCYLRVEIYSYYNLSLDAPNALLPLAPAPSRILPNVQDRHRNRGSVGAIAGGIVGGFAALLLAFVWRRKVKKAAVLPCPEDSTLHGTTSSMDKIALSSSEAASASNLGITVEKSVEFSYTELFDATEGFSMSNKIGQGGFGAVYYADLRGMKAAIKKMDMQASHEFLAELKVLTHVHHLNLVRLIGYCIESSLFIVYEYIENGNLSQHLRGTGGYEPLSWARRVQIALDSARGLEYIHEHTVPVYIHRDVKSANILIDKNYRSKVADFGMTKLIQVGNTSLPTRGIVGTFGYMSPEYGQYGDVSPKVDVYAFGVVLYELISAKEAIVRSAESCSDSKGLIYLFEVALSTPDPKEGLQRLLDPALGEDCPIDSVLEMAVLARACTQLDPKSRPTMRSVVVALMTLIVKMSDRVL